MKNCLVLVFFLAAFASFSQTLNYCDYFTLGVSEEEYEGKKLKSYWPITLKDRKDKFGKFLDKHSGRFEYLLFKAHAGFETVGHYYPDSVKIKNAFCSEVLNSDGIQSYFPSLSPKKLVAWNMAADTFSLDELMLVASRFFYCDAINKEDTTIQSHVCVGINGQNEYRSERDLTLLEAFSYEAIFNYLTRRKDPLFYSEFITFKRKAVKEKMNGFKDFDSFLIEIRNLCFQEMQKNSDLKNKLLAYYNANKSNLNFVLK